jgi:hypothetical protein
MTLDNLCVPHKRNVKEKYSGIDHIDYCRNQQHFASYPWPVDYSFNSRGFRDQEWPTTDQELESAIWCVGDSFTVGIGQPFEHTWPQVLAKHTGKPCINLGRDGAANDQIARTVVDIVHYVHPANIVVMWSYLHRRSVSIDTGVPNWKLWYDRLQDWDWPSCENLAEFQALPDHIQQVVIDKIGDAAYLQDLTQTQHFIRSTNEDDIEEFDRCVKLVEQRRGHTRIVHSVIPLFAPGAWIASAMQCVNDLPHVPHTVPRDLARDGQHFDLITAEWVVEQVVPQLRL